MIAMEWKDRTLFEKICIVFAAVLLAASFMAMVIEAFVLNVLPTWNWFFMCWSIFLVNIANRRAQPASIWTKALLVVWGVMSVLYTVFLILRFL